MAGLAGLQRVVQAELVSHAPGHEASSLGAPTRPALRAPWSLLVFVTLAGLAFVVLVPPGLPYDEPSHWANVLYYVDFTRLPELGAAGVTYEAQQGPLAYAINALVAAPLRLIDDSVAFYGVRAVSLLEHLLLTWLIWRLVDRLVGQRRGSGAAMLAALAVGLNPVLLTIGTSVQNDTLGLVLAVAALDVGLRRTVSPARAVASGVLVGLAMLTKIVFWPVALVLGLWMIWRGSLVRAIAYATPAAVLITWWVARNYLLYGDATGQAGVRAAGYQFPALSSVDPAGLIGNVVTYLWLPTEYVRNTVNAPAIIVGLVGLLTLAGCIGGVLLATRRSDVSFPELVALATIASVALTTWLVVVLTSQAVSFRFGYAALPFWFAAVGSLAFLDRLKWAVAALTVSLLAINAWFLMRVVALPSLSFEITF